MSMDALFEQLRHPNPHLREEAIWRIAESRDETTIPRLMSLLGEEDVVYRRAAVKTLGAIGLPAVNPLVETLKTSDNPVVRASCGKALAQVAVNYPDITFPEEALAGLKACIEDPNPVVHLVSIMALGEMGTQGLDILTESLQTTENPSVAMAVINALGSIPDQRAMDALCALSQDESKDEMLREAARSATSRLEQVIKFKQVNDARFNR